MNVPISQSTTHRHLKPPLLTMEPDLPESGRRPQRNLGRLGRKAATLIIVRDRKASEFSANVRANQAPKHMNEPLFSCLHEFGTNRISNQARGRVYVKFAHSGRSMRLRRFYAEI